MARPSGRAERATLDKASRELLERFALAYLNRFDSSRATLRKLLIARVRRAFGPEAGESAVTVIDELLARYEASGLIDDGRYAESIARGLRQRGSSRRLIEKKLRARGVADPTIERALFEPGVDGEQAELMAARRYAQKRRLGPFRTLPLTAKTRKRELGALSRAGFSLAVARTVLGYGPLDVEADDA